MRTDFAPEYEDRSYSAETNSCKKKSDRETDFATVPQYNAAHGVQQRRRGKVVEFSISRGKRENEVQKRERRRVSRTSTKAEAYVSRQGLPRYKGKVRDLSSTGAFVATGPLPIRERHVVKLNLVLDLGSVVRLHNRPAIVVRRSREGVALKFF
jgi:hypothetical protein